jgi:hypothetical protein
VEIFSPVIIRLPRNLTCFVKLITRYTSDALFQESREDRFFRIIVLCHTNVCLRVLVRVRVCVCVCVCVLFRITLRSPPAV